MISGPLDGEPDDPQEWEAAGGAGGDLGASSGHHDGSFELFGDGWGSEHTRGWVPPESRAWRHPSELRASPPTAVLVRVHDRRGATLFVGVAAAAAVVAGLLLLMNTGISPAPTALGTMTVSTAAITQCCRLAASLASDDEAAMVSIEAKGSKSGPTGCGVVVGDGRLLATTAAALDGARQVQAVAATGARMTATLVATDPGSGVALLRLPRALRVAPVDDASAAEVGSPAMTVSLSMRSAAQMGGRDQPIADWSSGTIKSIAAPIAPSDTDMAGIAVRGATVPAMPGEALVDVHGGVIGMLAGSSGPDRTYLPMPLVVAVASDLETMGRVRHGWLDVNADTPPHPSSTSAGTATTPGAMVVAVEPTGASAGTLRPGDLIVRVDGAQVVSCASLHSMLYLLPPGTRVTMDVMRDDQPVTAVVRLSPSP